MSEQFRILDLNYAQRQDVTVIASSEDPGFPASNLQQFLRAEVWRSSGFFRIGANRRLDFKDDALGPELTAVLTMGVYTIASLAAEIELQMGLVGADNYTVDFSELTGLWTIETDGDYLELLNASGSNVATSIADILGFNAEDESGELAYTGARIAIHTEERVTFDMGVRTDIDSFALLFDPLRPPGFSDTAVLKLQASDTNEWTAPPLSVTLTLDTTYRMASHFFAAAERYRYWSLQIVDKQNPNLFVEVAKVMLAKATQLGQVPQAGFGRRIADQSKSAATPYGHEYSDVYSFRGSQDFNYEFLEDADVLTLEAIFDRVGRTVPIAVVLDPFEECFDKHRFFIYGTIDSDLSEKHRFTTHFDFPLNIKETM